jgi:hypothetical protein
MYRTQSRDTDRDLEARLFERYRRMTIDEKLEHIGALGRLVEETALAGLRARYPESTEAENRLRLLARSVDRETMIRIYGWDPKRQGL